MRHKQQGITFLGLLILVVFVGLFVYAGIRLTPSYLEYMQVKKALTDVAAEQDGSANERNLRIGLQRRWDIEDIEGIAWQDVEITRDGNAFTMRAAWDDTQPFVANVQFLVSFDTQVEVAAR